MITVKNFKIKTTATIKKLNKLKTIFAQEKTKADNAASIDWDNIDKNNIQPILKDLLANNYNYNDWNYESFNDGSESKINDTLRSYLYNLRLNEIELNSQNTKNKTEQTGIHNYGRLYSNNDLTANSNSVLHNNKGSLIYSNNNINFNINKVLFNNENSMGQGIFANNNINIRGFANNNTNNTTNNASTTLGKLINYDGRIEANNNIDIRANSVLNYGSDDIDIRDNPYSAASQNIIQYFDGYPGYDDGFKLYRIYTYTSTLTSNSSYIQSNNGDINIETGNDSNSNLINYNSNIYGNN